MKDKDETISPQLQAFREGLERIERRREETLQRLRQQVKENGGSSIVDLAGGVACYFLEGRDPNDDAQFVDVRAYQERKRKESLDF